jgi:hypothetical protein
MEGVGVKERFEVVACRRSDAVWWKNARFQLFGLCKFVSQYTSVTFRYTYESLEYIMYNLSIFGQPGVRDALDAAASTIQRQRRDCHTCKSDPKCHSSHIGGNSLSVALGACRVLKVAQS